MRDLFNNIKPSLGPFAPALSTWIGQFIGLIWFLAFIYAAYHLIIAIAAVAKARKQHRQDVEELTGKIIFPVGVLIALVLIPTIWAAIVTI